MTARSTVLVASPPLQLTMTQSQRKLGQMDSENVDIPSKFVHALRTQVKTVSSSRSALPRPYPGHHDCTFQTEGQLYDHVKAEHAAQVGMIEPLQARDKLTDEALKLR